jgi:hypothetical protein
MLATERAPTYRPLCRGMAIAESLAASRQIPRQLWGREKMKFEPLRQTKDLAGVSRETKREHPFLNQTATRASARARPFSQMKAPAGGLTSLFPHKVHSFFGKLCRAAACEDRTPTLLLPPDNVPQRSETCDGCVTSITQPNRFSLGIASDPSQGRGTQDYPGSLQAALWTGLRMRLSSRRPHEAP